MEKQIRFPEKQEHSVQVENLTLRMLTYPIYRGEEHSVRRYAIHTHAHAELFACSEGSFHLQTENGLITVGSGDIVIVPPDFPHRKLPSPPETVWHCLDFVCVERRRANTVDLKERLAPICNSKHLLMINGEPELCHEIAKAASLMQEAIPSLPALRLITVLAELSTKPMQKVARGDTLHTPTPVIVELSDINRLSRLDYLINACFVDPELSLSRAAKLLYISERQLERIMKKEYGLPFRRALCERRLNAATQMLCETDLSGEQIATAVGFRTCAAFGRAFVQKHGQTPAEYRAKHAPSRG